MGSKGKKPKAMTTVGTNFFRPPGHAAKSSNRNENRTEVQKGSGQKFGHRPFKATGKFVAQQPYKDIQSEKIKSKTETISNRSRSPKHLIDEGESEQPTTGDRIDIIVTAEN